MNDTTLSPAERIRTFADAVRANRDSQIKKILKKNIATNSQIFSQGL